MWKTYVQVLIMNIINPRPIGNYDFPFFATVEVHLSYADSARSHKGKVRLLNIPHHQNVRDVVICFFLVFFSTYHSVLEHSTDFRCSR